MIYVGFSTTNGLLSRIIRWATRATVSHTFLIVDDTTLGGPLVIEEAWCGCRVTTLERFQKSARVVDVLVPPVPLESAVREAVAMLGQRYDWAGLVGMLFVLVGRYLGRKVRNPLRSAHAMFCSELNTRILQEAGYPGAEALDASATDPDDLRGFMLSTGSKRVTIEDSHAH